MKYAKLVISAALVACGTLGGAPGAISVAHADEYCYQDQSTPEFATCLAKEIANAFLKQNQQDATYADSQVGTNANTLAKTTGTTLETVAKRYFPMISFNSQSKQVCNNYDVDVRNGSDQVNVDKGSCLNAGVLVGEAQNGLNLFACYAYQDEPVILTGLSCRNTGGGVPVFISAHNAAAIGGLAAVRGAAVCNEASGLHPGAQNVMGQRVGANMSNTLTVCATAPR